jgi:beta-mannosidase
MSYTQPITYLTVARLCTALFLLSGLPLADGAHHMATKAPRKLQRRKLDITPLLVTNNCPDDIWPGISTQSGTGPGVNGFKLEPGKTRNQTVSEDWQGRVWGRTNCSFNDGGTGSSQGSGKACLSGDCNSQLDCKVGVSNTIQRASIRLELPSS